MAILQMKKKPRHYTRWMIRRDLPQVLAFENLRENPWTKEDFIRSLRETCVIGMVAEVGQDVIGCILYRLHKEYLEVFHVAGAGQSDMAKKLIGKLSGHRRRRVVAKVPLSDINTIRSLMAEGYIPARQLDGDDNLALTYCLPREKSDSLPQEVPYSTNSYSSTPEEEKEPEYYNLQEEDPENQYD